MGQVSVETDVVATSLSGDGASKNRVPHGHLGLGEDESLDLEQGGGQRPGNLRLGEIDEGEDVAQPQVEQADHSKSESQQIEIKTCEFRVNRSRLVIEGEEFQRNVKG